MIIGLTLWTKNTPMPRSQSRGEVLLVHFTPFSFSTSPTPKLNGSIRPVQRMLLQKSYINYFSPSVCHASTSPQNLSSPPNLKARSPQTLFISHDVDIAPPLLTLLDGPPLSCLRRPDQIINTARIAHPRGGSRRRRSWRSIRARDAETPT